MENKNYLKIVLIVLISGFLLKSFGIIQINPVIAFSCTSGHYLAGSPTAGICLCESPGTLTPSTLPLNPQVIIPYNTEATCAYSSLTSSWAYSAWFGFIYNTAPTQVDCKYELQVETIEIEEGVSMWPGYGADPGLAGETYGIRAAFYDYCHNEISIGGEVDWDFSVELENGTLITDYNIITSEYFEIEFMDILKTRFKIKPINNQLKKYIFTSTPNVNYTSYGCSPYLHPDLGIQWE